MMAAIAAAGTEGDSESGNRVFLIEKNEKLGKKLFITGKGRCNVTNACEAGDFFQNVMEHAKFLYSAVYGFDSRAVMDFFERSGCPLKVERGQRVFPKSDHSSDIIRALEREMTRLGVQVMLNTEVKAIRTTPFETAEPATVASATANKKQKSSKKKKICHARIAQIELYDKVTGKNRKRCGQINHSDRRALLCPDWFDWRRLSICARMWPQHCSDNAGARAVFCGGGLVQRVAGFVSKNVQVSVELVGKRIYSDFGEMLFTHYGVSGPLILSASSHYVHSVCGTDCGDNKAKLYIDLKPALTHDQLDQRILREFDANKNKQFKNVINSLFPAKLVPVMPVLADIDPDKRVNEITREERERFVRTIKHMELTVTGLRDYNEAVITRGGVSTSEVVPSTMESRLVSGLYFAGEVLDLDALTGGYNLQIAWSTGYLAGKSAACIHNFYT